MSATRRSTDKTPSLAEVATNLERRFAVREVRIAPSLACALDSPEGAFARRSLTVPGTLKPAQIEGFETHLEGEVGIARRWKQVEAREIDEVLFVGFPGETGAPETDDEDCPF